MEKNIFRRVLALPSAIARTPHDIQKVDFIIQQKFKYYRVSKNISDIQKNFLHFFQDFLGRVAIFGPNFLSF